METKDEIYQQHVTERNLDNLPIVTIQMTDKDKCCDMYPYKSIHEIQTDSEGNDWIVGRVNSIPREYSKTVISDKFKNSILGRYLFNTLVTCNWCKNKFLLKYNLNKNGYCPRCANKLEDI